MAPQDNHTLVKCLEYIEYFYFEDLCLQSIADHANVSKYKLTRLFHLALGKSPMRWVWIFRVHLARALMHAPPPLSLSDIAFEVGFNSQAHFCRSFRAYFGSAPSQLRMAMPREDHSHNFYDDLRISDHRKAAKLVMQRLASHCYPVTPGDQLKVILGNKERTWK